MAKTNKLPVEPAPVKKVRKAPVKKAKASEPAPVQDAEFIPEPEPEFIPAPDPYFTIEPFFVPDSKPEPTQFTVSDIRGIYTQRFYSSFFVDDELISFKIQMIRAFCIKNDLPIDLVTVQ